MDVQSYCDNLNLELTGWRAKVDNVVKKLDKVSSGDEEKVVPMVNELHMVTKRVGNRIERLQRECPTHWEPEKIELEDKFSQLEINWDKVSQNISAGDIGG